MRRKVKVYQFGEALEKANKAETETKSKVVLRFDVGDWVKVEDDEVFEEYPEFRGKRGSLTGQVLATYADGVILVLFSTGLNFIKQDHLRLVEDIVGRR